MFTVISDKDWMLMKAGAVVIFLLAFVALGWLWTPVLIGWFKVTADQAFRAAISLIGG